MTGCWRPVTEPGFEELYQVSDRGRIWSVPRQTRTGVRGGNYLTPGVMPKGYLTVVLSGPGELRRTCLVHVLVLEAFDRRPEAGEECRHLNGNPADNRWPENICWALPVVNAADKKLHGTDSAGTRNAMAKLTEAQVLEIKARYASGGESQQAIAAAYGLRQPQVSKIVTGKSWEHLQ